MLLAVGLAAWNVNESESSNKKHRFSIECPMGSSHISVLEKYRNTTQHVNKGFLCGEWSEFKYVQYFDVPRVTWIVRWLETRLTIRDSLSAVGKRHELHTGGRIYVTPWPIRPTAQLKLESRPNLGKQPPAAISRGFNHSISFSLKRPFVSFSPRPCDVPVT
ncbi:hypothetical protein K0M31_003267 [Melipona bicolor]|uniref:Uncharacterized protein n=1 Tax=Melipona bicolor TaxID=60889 RepID=A0AA40KPB0_9HYME|nr:hypothetical protein K0M31_003267 [Melipona bicolor]